MHPFRLRPLSLALLTISTSVFVHASPTQLDTIVVSAAGYEQKITDAPASISVITQEQLTKKPYMTLLDAVRELEGVDIGETNDKTGQGSISMRGMGSDYTLILVDGKRQNNHGDIYPNSFSGNQFNHIPPLDAIERIEVIRGPASTLYGADAMGGVINIITKKVTDTWTGSVTHSRTFEENDAFGEDQTIDFNVMGPLIKDKLGLTVRGSLYERDESNPSYAPVTDPSGVVHTRGLGFGGGGRTVNNDNMSYGARLSWNINPNQSLWADIDRSRQEYDNDQAQLGTLDSIDSIWRQKCSLDKPCDRADPRVGYQAEQRFTRDTWSLTHEGDWDIGKSFVSLAHVKTNNHGRTLPFTVAERQHLLDMLNATNDYAGLSEEQRKTIAAATFLPRPERTLQSEQYTLDANIKLPFQWAGEHNVILGTQVIQGELTDGVFGMESGKPTQSQEHNMWSLFAEDTWQITQPFALTTGLRYDNHEIFGDQLSPRLYGVYDINDALTIKGGVSTGYKTPKTTQLYEGVVGFGGQGTTPNFGNPDLKPETSISSELAAYWQHPAGHHLNATIFHNIFEDKISSQPCGGTSGLVCANTGEYAELGYSSANRTTNIDEVIIQGVEVAGKWQMLDQVSLRANYTYTDSEQKSGVNKGRPYGNAAKHMANATLDWIANDAVNLFLTTEYRGDRFRQMDTTTNQALYYKNATVLHLGGSYKINDTFTLNARVNNLLDEDFTSYSTTFKPNNDGSYTPSYLDDYNNKEKSRSYWLSLNTKF
ncbi:TonB-dependent receptor [uncultured Acinetobacter sp.]|uniref:TonB-dependent receptor domain-containing protein n=1 Tax=uncultured Acinetobacter sp. TaxID=165433 RepID=UPI00262AD6CC|nr:TonB-dependent receptor [uncultured Acinetobacter sp.]